MIKRTLSTSSMLLSQNAVTSITTKIRPFIATATATIATTTIKNLKNKMMSKKPAVLYHYPCPDGAFAALAAHLYFSSTSTPALFFPNTVYSPLRAEDLPVNEIDQFAKQIGVQIEVVKVFQGACNCLDAEYLRFSISHDPGIH